MGIIKNSILAGRLSDQKGVTAVLVAIVLLPLFGFAALAVDVGYMYTTRNELQNIADAAALAGAYELGQDGSTTEIETAASQVALKNHAADQSSITIKESDISIGQWDWEKEAFSGGVSLSEADAVRVIARRDENANNPVATFFARTLPGSFDMFQATAKATAVLSDTTVPGVGNTEPMAEDTLDTEKLIFPMGISEEFEFPPDGDDFTIKFNPYNPEDMGVQFYLFPDFLNQLDNEGNPKSFSEALVDRVKALSKGEFSENIIPDELSVGENLEFGNVEGNDYFLAQTYINKIFNENADKDDDGDDDIWTTVVPVYKESGVIQDNPEGSTEIVAFTTIMIRKTKSDEEDFWAHDSTKIKIIRPSQSKPKLVE